MVTVTMIFELGVIVFCIQTSSAGYSVNMPYCKTKQRCDEMWEAPNISDCIKEMCMCTRGSVYVESLLTCKCRDGHVVGNTGCLPAASQLGSSCEESIQCTRLGEPVACEAGKCSCLKDALIINGTCHVKKYPNQICTFEEECDHISKLVCLGNSCVCEGGYFLSTDKLSCLLEESEESSSTADLCSGLRCDEEKDLRETEETTENPANSEPRRNVGSLGWTMPSFLTLSLLLLSQNILMCRSRM